MLAIFPEVLLDRRSSILNCVPSLIVLQKRGLLTFFAGA